MSAESAREIEAKIDYDIYWMDGEEGGRKLSPMARQIAMAFDRITSEAEQHETFVKVMLTIGDVTMPPAPGADLTGRRPKLRRVAKT